MEEKLSGPDTIALVMAPVPLPVRRPPSVVEPVPPKLTASVVVPLTTPVEFANRIEFWIPEIVRLLVDAVDEKKLVAVRAVEEAKLRKLLPIAFSEPIVEVPIVALLENRFVVEARPET